MLITDKQERAERMNAELISKGGNREVVDHIPDQNSGEPSIKKRATDPTVGRIVTMENVNDDFTKSVENPHVKILCPLKISLFYC